MLHRLGHDPFIQGDYEKHQINAADSRKHVFDKLLMARNVDNSDVDTVRIQKVCKAQLNGDSSLLLLLQPVCVNSAESLDQTGFAVIHMSCGSNNHILHPAIPPCPPLSLPGGLLSFPFPLFPSQRCCALLCREPLQSAGTHHPRLCGHSDTLHRGIHG
ncbi:putative uncharacterized protein [Clostridium sp. CAG:149]|nr:putative uncharacterized protein [Clostridium sp. CAG:149]